MRLHLYFARKFALGFATLFAMFFTMLTLLDLVEQFRRFQSADLSFGNALELALLAVPQSIYAILPLIVILTTLSLFVGLARTSEMVVTRAAGRSALRALIAPVGTALLIGLLGVVVMNPIVAATQKQYELRSQDYTIGGRQVLSISAEGLWLRQGNPQGQTVIHAERANLDGSTLFTTTFVEFDATGSATRRIESQSATLGARRWTLRNAKVWPIADVTNPERAATTHETLVIDSTLTREQILDGFGTPSSIPIWELPAYINNLDRAGFSARLHRVWLQMELASPFFLAGMVMIAAGFTMRHTRFGRTGQMVLYALMLGLGLYFIRNFAQILGENGPIPVLFAAWSPPVAAIFLSLGLLLHLEDG